MELVIHGINATQRKYKYRYSGKELQTAEWGQDGHGLELYDFGSRYYQATTGRWHVPDPAEQFHNPYIGIGNNPVVYTDPNGELALTTALTIGSVLFSSMEAGVYATQEGESFLSGFGPGMINGAINAIPSFAVGQAFGPVGGIWKEAARSITHGLTNGGVALIRGEEFAPSFAAASLASATGSLSNNWSGLAQIGVSALSGGIGSELTGGDFWNGFTQGAVVTALNHRMHEGGPGDELSEEHGIPVSEWWDLNGDGKITLEESYRWYKLMGGSPIDVPINSLDLSGITAAHFDGVGSVETFNLLFRGNFTDGLVHGEIALRLYPDNTVRAFDGPYDFDYKPWTGLKNIVRNMENFVGKQIHGNGTPFHINFTGSAKIGSNRNILVPNNPSIWTPWNLKF